MARDMPPEAETPTGDNLSPTEVRKRWFVEMRRQGHRQCRGAFELHSERVCPLYLLAEMLGVDSGVRAGRLAGLSELQICNVIHMNDSLGFTYAQITDVC